MSRAHLELLAESRQVRRATDDLRQLNIRGESATNVVGQLRRAFVLLGGAATLGKAITTTANFSQEIANLSAITGAAGRDLEFYRQQAAEIGRTTSLSASQAAEAFKLIASAQPDLLNSAEALSAVTKEAVTLAEATGMTLPAAATALGGAINQFQLSANQANEVINILAASSQRGTVGVESITESLVNAGAAANALGLDLAETVAGLQGLARANITGARAGTALNQVLLGLERTNDQQLMPSVNGLVDALDNLAERQLSNNEIIKQFGREALPAVQALLAQRDAARSLNTEIRGTSVATEQASIRMDTLTGDFKQLQSAIEGLTIATFGQDIENVNRSLVQTATEGVGALTENLDKLATAATVVAAVVGARIAGSLSVTTVAFIRAQAEAARYQATLASMAGVTRGVAASQLALGKALSFVGGPVGVAALAAFSVFKLSQSYRDGLQAQEDRTQRIMEEYKAQQALNQELQKAGRLFEDTDKATAAGATAMDNYKRAVDAAYQAHIQGMNQTQIQEEFDNVTESLARAERRLERVGERFAEGTLRYQQAEEAVRVLRAQLEALGGVYPNITTSQEQASEALAKVTQSLEDQIYQLREGDDAYELLIAARQAGVALDSQEAAGIKARIDLRNELIAAINAEDEARRQSEQNQRQFESLQGELQTAGMSPEQLARQELDARLDVIREFYELESNEEAIRREEGILAEEAYQQRLTEIQQQQADAATQALQTRLASASQLFGDLNSLANAFGDEQNAINQALFVAQKGFSIAQSIIAIQTGIAQAAALPFPANLGAMATVAGATAGIVSTIERVQPTPRALGGQVLDGNQYLVGERGPEVISMRGNGNVTPNHKLMTGGGDTINQQANISFTIPNSDNDIRRVLDDSRDIIYNAVNEALRRQGRTL